MVEEAVIRNGGYMNRLKSSPPNLLESLVYARVAERLQTLKNLEYSEAISWAANNDADDLNVVVLCHRCDIGELEDKFELDPAEYHIEYPATLSDARGCILCNAPVKYHMRSHAIPTFFKWTTRLRDAGSGVPASYWISVLAVLEGANDEVLNSVGYELFLHAVLDLDLLQP